MRFIPLYAQRALQIAGLSLFLVACSGSAINQANFDKIQNDMTTAQVVAILGEPTESSSINIGPLSGSNSTWKNDTSTINIQFVNGTVKLKSFEKK